ncbi:MAG: hypothetical protein OJF49_003296 [Ktedonobacterales bacterium]|nr:MAG: hypothetical protein OJF49_003296 [Ktedonobacterales bacterium]
MALRRDHNQFVTLAPRTTGVQSTPLTLVSHTGGESIALAHTAIEFISQLGVCQIGRVLVFEPRSALLGLALRENGFTGECFALMRRVLPSSPQIARGFDGVLLEDWQRGLDEATNADEGANAAFPLSGENAATTFHLIIAPNVLRFMPASDVVPLLTWLASLLEPRGYLIYSEPDADSALGGVEKQMIEAGLLLAAEPEIIEDAWPQVVFIFQNRSKAESHAIGVLQRFTWPMLEHDPDLRHSTVEAYREAFGDIEWREWLRCTRPYCGRHYGREEAALLKPPHRCICGWSEPLEPYYSEEMVLEKLAKELGDDERSCCYLRQNTDGVIAAFGWGYLTDDETIITALQPPRDHLENLRASVRQWLQSVRGFSSDGEQIYYHSEEAVLKGTRSLSLTRALFHRALQFAWGRGACLVVLYTSPQSGAYALLTGIGMQILHRYDARQYSEESLLSPSETLGESEPDERVVLGGEIAHLLGILSRESDRQIAVRIAHRLREERERGGKHEKPDISG